MHLCEMILGNLQIVLSTGKGRKFKKALLDMFFMIIEYVEQKGIWVEFALVFFLKEASFVTNV